MNYFNPGAFVSNFHYLVSGMLGIFLVIGIIADCSQKGYPNGKIHIGTRGTINADD